MASFTLLSNPIIVSEPTTLTIGDILNSYDGPAFEKAINDIPESHHIRELFSRHPRGAAVLCESILHGLEYWLHHY